MRDDVRLGLVCGGSLAALWLGPGGTLRDVALVGVLWAVALAATRSLNRPPNWAFHGGGAFLIVLVLTLPLDLMKLTDGSSIVAPLGATLIYWTAWVMYLRWHEYRASHA